MKATALTFPDNSTQAHFAGWAWGSGQWPTPTTYGFSSFIYNAGFIQTGNTSTFAGTFERSNIIGDGQLVWANITFNVTSTQATGNTSTGAIYGFSGLAGGALRAGMYLTVITGTTNDSSAFNVSLTPSSPAGTVVVITSVTYTTSTSGTFTTPWTSGVVALQAESGTGQVNSTVSTFFWTAAQTFNTTLANNVGVGGTANAGYGNPATGNGSQFKGYWQVGTTYSIGDVVIYAGTATGPGATSVIGTFVNITGTNATPPTTNTPGTNWVVCNYEIWQTGDSALPQYVQSNQEVQSVTFNPLPFNAPNTAGNTLIAFGRFTGGSGAPTIKDTNNNTWIQLFSNTNGSDINVAWAAYVVAGTTTTNYVTVSQPTQSTLQLAIAEYSGVTSVAPQLDQSTSATGTSTSASSGNVTTLVANELILGFIDNATSNGLTVTPTNGFTARQTVNGNLVLMDKTVAATGTYAATATLSASVNWFAAIATLKGTQLPPFYFKFEYGNINSNIPCLGLQIGTAITSTGALAITGNRSFRELIGYTSAANNAATQYESDFYADITPGLAGGKFAMLGWRNAPSPTFTNWFIGWERSKDNFGVDTGLYMTYVIGRYAGNASSWNQSSVFATGGVNYSVRSFGASQFTANLANGSAMAYSIIQDANSNQTGNAIAVSPVFPSVSFFGNPLTILLGLSINDTAEGAVFATTVYGANHNYLMTKSAASGSFAQYFASASLNSGVAMRWE